MQGGGPIVSAARSAHQARQVDRDNGRADNIRAGPLYSPGATAKTRRTCDQRNAEIILDQRARPDARAPIAAP
jgi:hypothetical protein